MRCEDYLSILAYQSVLEDCPRVPGACTGDAALNSSGQAAVMMSSALLVPSSSSRTQLLGDSLPRQLLQCQAENDCAPWLPGKLLAVSYGRLKRWRLLLPGANE